MVWMPLDASESDHDGDGADDEDGADDFHEGRNAQLDTERDIAVGGPVDERMHSEDILRKNVHGIQGLEPCGRWNRWNLNR